MAGMHMTDAPHIITLRFRFWIEYTLPISNQIDGNIPIPSAIPLPIIPRLCHIFVVSNMEETNPIPGGRI